MKVEKECVVLMDNGSLRPEAVVSLRSVAANLTERLGLEVRPVSLLHSSKIPADKLDGRPADTWKRFLRQGIEKGITRFRVLPLFFGPSSAIVDYLPKVTREVMGRYGSAQVAVAETLVDLSCPEDDAVSSMLAEYLIQSLNTNTAGERPGVIVVDHGSPLPDVAACRNLVAKQVAERLGDRARGVIASSMERREGEAYAFNEPLLETALETAERSGWRRVLLSYLFFSPGRHAGPGGDIDGIVAASSFVANGGTVESMPLVGESPGLVPLLAKRFEASLRSGSFISPAG